MRRQTHTLLIACSSDKWVKDSTCAAKSLNGKNLALLHANPLLAPPHIGHALVAMYLVLIDLVPVQPSNDLNLKSHNPYVQPKTQ